MTKKEQIDGCVILELVLEQNRNKQQRLLQQQCRQYLYRIGDHDHGFISLPALGEIFRAFYDLDDTMQIKMVSAVYDILERSSIRFSTPSYQTYQLAKEIGDSDTILKPADALRIAEAITNQATLITIDKQLVQNKTLQERFKVNIKEPY